MFADSQIAESCAGAAIHAAIDVLAVSATLHCYLPLPPDMLRAHCETIMQPHMHRSSSWLTDAGRAGSCPSHMKSVKVILVLSDVVMPIQKYTRPKSETRHDPYDSRGHKRRVPNSSHV